MSAVLNDLNKIGENVFWSEYYICNELSANWHRKFGFVEVTDIVTAKFRRDYYRREAWRQEKLGDMQKSAEIKSLFKLSEAEVVRLERLEKENYGAARLRWKYDY